MFILVTPPGMDPLHPSPHLLDSKTPLHACKTTLSDPQKACILALQLLLRALPQQARWLEARCLWRPATAVHRPSWQVVEVVGGNGLRDHC